MRLGWEHIQVPLEAQTWTKAPLWAQLRFPISQMSSRLRRPSDAHGAWWDRDLLPEEAACWELDVGMEKHVSSSARSAVLCQIHYFFFFPCSQ